MEKLPQPLIDTHDGDTHEIQLADDVYMANSNTYSSLYRHNACLHTRLAYTHSDCSSSLSSISMASRQQQQLNRVYSNYKQNMLAYKRQAQSNSWAVNIVRRILVFLIVGLGAGFCMIHGIFQQIYTEEFSQYSDNSATLEYSFAVTLVGATQFVCFVGFVHLSLSINHKLNKYAAMMLGAVITSGGLLAAGFANNIWQLCLSQGILVGIGAAFTSVSAVASLKSKGILQTTGSMLAIGGVGGGVLALVASQLIIQQQSTRLALCWIALLVGGGELFAITVLFLVDYWIQPPTDNGDCAGMAGKNIDSSLHITTTFTTTTTVTSGYTPTRLSTNWQCVRQPHHILYIVSSFFYHLSVPAPFLFIPSYANQQLSSTNSMSSAAFLATLCFSLAIGSAAFTRALKRQHLSYSAMLGLLHASCSLVTWCFWLPAAKSWVMAVIFCIAYGLISGMASMILLFESCDITGSGTRNAPPAWIPNLTNGTGLFIGVCIDGWLLVSFAETEALSFSPLIAFAASAGLAAAMSSAVSAALTPSPLANRTIGLDKQHSRYI